MQQRSGGAGRPSAGAPPSRYVGYGLTWAVSTILFLLGGQWLDGVAATAPLFTLLGAFVGAGAGFWYMYFHLVIEPRRREREKDGSE